MSDLVVPIAGALAMLFVSIALAFRITLGALSRRDLDQATARAMEHGGGFAPWARALAPYAPQILGFLARKRAGKTDPDPATDQED